METTLHRGCQMIGAAEMPECWRKRLDGAHGMLIGAHLRASPHVGVR